MKEKQLAGKQRGEGLMNQHPQTWPSEQPQSSSCTTSAHQDQGRHSPAFGGNRGERVCCFHVPREMGTMPPDTLGRSAWLQVGFRKMTLGPSRTQSWKIPPFPNSLGRNNIRSHQSDHPQTMDGHNRGPWTLRGLPRLDQELLGTWHWLPGAAAPQMPVVPKRWTPPLHGHPHAKAAELLGGVTGGKAKPQARRDTRRNEEARPERASAQLTSARGQGGKSGVVS